MATEQERKDNPPPPKQDVPAVSQHKRAAQGDFPPITGPKTPA